ncbi:glutathione S-transferase kappa 1 [Galendromus occidentalis]|uniref:Glutathione S-transferase kappa n=1 Tax=Galendromus occidentalis TaxID=34638 RepID=A0AAJ6QNL5_9ACAR|nr:glutathione S-transferase kappa 1 [Galendromus occidentalis]
MTGQRFVVELFYDVVSPYTYFAFEALCRYRQAWDMELKLRPFLLSGLMRESGNKSPAVVLNKGIYCAKDLHRLSKYYNIPFGLHRDYVQWVLSRNTLHAQRFLCAIDLYRPEYLETVSRHFFRRFFGEQKEIMSLECLPKVAAAAELPRDVVSDCLQALDSEPVKTLLRKNTGEALQLSAFGSPTIVATINGRRETYFGQDRLLLLAHDAGKPWLGPHPDAPAKL